MTPTQPTLPFSTCVCGDPDCTVPFGFCHCGCGSVTPVFTVSCFKRGRVKGNPARYLRGHNPKPDNTLKWPEDLCVCGDRNCTMYGTCHCGCGSVTKIATYTNQKTGCITGRHKRFLQGHRITQPTSIPDGMCVCGKENCEIPFGDCHCGCGEKTTVITDSRYSGPAAGRYLGMPIAFISGHSRRLSPVEYIVEDRGYKTPCWVWQRNLNPKGYGTKGKGDGTKGTVATHIWYWENKFGKVPEGKQLDHLCRQRSCCNPEHLEPVTNAENTQRGLTAVVSPDEVISIRSMVSGGMRQTDVARRLGISRAIVHGIISGRTWRNI